MATRHRVVMAGPSTPGRTFGSSPRRRAGGCRGATAGPPATPPWADRPAPRRSPRPWRAPEPPHRAEVPQQRLAPGLAQTRDAVEGARGHRLGPLLAVVGDREAVRLVAYPLQEVEALAGARQDHRVGLARQPHLLEPLREPAQGDVGRRRVVHRLPRPRRPAARRRRRRRGSAGRRTPSPAGLGVDRAALPAVVGRRPDSSSRPRAAFGVAAEPSGDASWIEAVSSALDAPDGEPAVLALAGQPVLEDHHRRDDARALQVGHVEALDAQRRLVEAERVLDLLQRAATGREVASHDASCAARGPAWRCGCTVSTRCAFVATARHPQVDARAAASPSHRSTTSRPASGGKDSARAPPRGMSAVVLRRTPARGTARPGHRC